MMVRLELGSPFCNLLSLCNTTYTAPVEAMVVGAQDINKGNVQNERRLVMMGRRAHLSAPMHNDYNNVRVTDALLDMVQLSTTCSVKEADALYCGPCM